MLPKDSDARKGVPLARGCLHYFPDALAAVAELSKKGNDKHNPGQELHWSREKSNDHGDCIARHLIDAGKDGTVLDADDNVLHIVKVAWRALALAQIVIEAQVKAEDGWISWFGSPVPPVNGDAMVAVRFRNGTERKPRRGDYWGWYHDGDFNDIVAYKVVS